MTIGQALIKVGNDAANAAEALQAATKVTAARRQLNVADHKAIMEALRFTTHAVYAKNTGLLAHTLRLIEARQAHYEAMGDAGRTLAVAMSSVHEFTRHAQTAAARANSVDQAFDFVRLDVQRLAERHSPAAEPAPRRGRAVVARVADATALINQFAGAISPDDGVIYDIVTALGSASDIVVALKIVCYQEADLLNAGYASAKMEREAKFPFEALTAAWKGLNVARQTLSETAKSARAAAKLEAELLAAAR